VNKPHSYTSRDYAVCLWYVSCQLSASCSVWNWGRSGVRGPTISGCVDSLAVTRFRRGENKFNFHISNRDFRSITLWNMLSLERRRIM